MFKNLKILLSMCLTIICGAATYSGCVDINYYLAVVLTMVVGFGGFVLCLYQIAD